MTYTPLPALLAEIEAVAGRDAALEIALEHGGHGLYVPRDIARPGGGRLVALVGEEAAQAIIQGFGGHVVQVPLARRALVHHLAQQGLGTGEIAARLAITERTARRYRGGPWSV